MDIAAWLRALGLEQYAAAFRDNDIDARVLPGLTAEDLREIGVSSVGHRRRLLRAIAALHEPPATVAGPAAGLAAALPRAERRQLTVMFVDLVGSTALAHGLDPEDMREIIRAYQNAAAGEIFRFSGHVANFMGDGILAYFGWPKAQEDAAERAVRAGLAVTEAVRRLGTPGEVPLAARVGIATGLVVVGEVVGEGGAQEEAVVGETPNLAARLQAAAEPGQVVIGDDTRRLVGRLFDLQALGAQVLKGLAEPVPVFAVLGAGKAESRFEALHGAGLTPLVGREQELALLLGRWRQARDGEGQVVLLSGEPGIGKSRLVRALHERLKGELHLPLSQYCSPFHQTSALYPVIDLFERAARFARDDRPEQKLAKLEALLAQGTEDVAAAVPPIAALLSIPADGRYPPLDLTPQRLKDRTFDVLLGQLAGLAARQPVLVLYEDAHWADPTTVELIELIIERVQSLPVLVVITFRPDFAPPWPGRAHLIRLTLDRLSRKRGTAIVAELTGGRALPPEVLEQIVAKTDGVPLFVEELTKAVLESGLLRNAGDRYELAGELPPLAIPATLQDSLLARLDRLAPVKEVAQVAAAIGRGFPYELLAAVAPLPDNALRDALAQLAEAELVFRRGDPPAATYVFKHALVRDAAYQSLLKSKRQQLHARIAQALAERFPATVDTEPELLAHHYTEAGLVGPAAEHWLAAAQRAKDAYANKEAALHLRRCLDAIDAARANTGDRSPDLVGRKQRALVMLGDLASLAGDLEEANRCYERALELPCGAEIRTLIENKRHRPRVAMRDGARIAFYEHGSGPDTLVFVAPLTYGLATFQPIVERLCQEFRIVTIDSRGTGASDPLTRPYPLGEHVKDIRAVIEALGGGPVVGVGLSRGSNFLLSLAHAEPRLFDRLVTIGCPAGGSGPYFTEAYKAQRELLDQGDFEAIVQLHTVYMFSEPATRELREMFVRQRLELPRETMLSFFDPDPTIDVTPLLGAIATPVLVTHGSADQLIDFAAAGFIAARLPDARVYAFEGKGHLPLFTATDEFCQVLGRFVRTGMSAFESRLQTA